MTSNEISENIYKDPETGEVILSLIEVNDESIAEYKNELEYSNLDSITLIDCAFESWEAIRGVKKVNEIALKEMVLTPRNLSNFSHEQLKSIIIWKCSGINDFTSLGSFPSLSALSVEYNQDLRSLNGISNANNTNHVDCSYCPNLSDISELLNLPKLRRVQFYACPNISLDVLTALKAKGVEVVAIQYGFDPSR